MSSACAGGIGRSEESRDCSVQGKRPAQASSASRKGTIARSGAGRQWSPFDATQLALGASRPYVRDGVPRLVRVRGCREGSFRAASRAGLRVHAVRLALDSGALARSRGPCPPHPLKRSGLIRLSNPIKTDQGFRWHPNPRSRARNACRAFRTRLRRAPCEKGENRPEIGLCRHIARARLGTILVTECTLRLLGEAFSRYRFC